MSRDSLKKSNSLLKDSTAFVEGAEQGAPQIIIPNKLDKKKPFTISATVSEGKMLQDLVKKYNSIAYNREDGEKEINRSELVIAMTTYFDQLNDDDFFESVNKLISYYAVNGDLLGVL
ncbi:hypothetical protein [Shewanella sairae]|nr:hypothetical protein [Shewanella sairae]MCL1132415.1 hypothetical protein [Shewanella sairae]